ncbi:MAG: gamma carbonic anhydrase family protein [Bacteroidetes bacterium]|uniref:Gamma carbonic anhydrase family protein n=1 Tax=Candidatus Merdivivens pullistercoris TaxID=2840873 RepID=A0A9D9N9N2_9BACT|nr:gamma carbonic anhydrase family protein [Candidatus Merdivivens pullistercoris]
MAIIREVLGFTPVIGERCFIAENAAIIGDVKIGDDCSIWYGTVLRGDVNSIIIGDRVNIQDGAVLHTLYKRSVVEIGNDVSVGHNAVIHGAKIGNNVLVGMGAVLLDNVVVPDNTIIAAGAVVLSNSVLEPGIYAGVPAKKVKDSSETVADMTKNNAAGYLRYKEWFLDGSVRDEYRNKR